MCQQNSMNMKKTIEKYTFVLFNVVVLLAIFYTPSCTPTSEYHRLVERELSSGMRYDSLFFDLHFGTSRKDFFATCWELNKKGLMRQGNQNHTVMVELKNDLKMPADMNFYPDFYEDKIYEMPVYFAYQAFAPWNKATLSDSLQLDVLKLMEKWYGEGFISIEHETHGKAFVQVKGNRRVSVFREGDRLVKVLITDLSATDALQAAKARREQRKQELELSTQ